MNIQKKKRKFSHCLCINLLDLVLIKVSKLYQFLGCLLFVHVSHSFYNKKSWLIAYFVEKELLFLKIILIEENGFIIPELKVSYIEKIILSLTVENQVKKAWYPESPVPILFFSDSTYKITQYVKFSKRGIWGVINGPI